MSRQPVNQNVGLSILKTFIWLISFIILCISLTFAYLAFGDACKGWFDPPVYVDQKNRGTLDEDWDRVENGIHIRTGLVYAKGFAVVNGTCTACHSAKLITQNRASRQGWQEMIMWMQETQGLWDLGGSEKEILDYLSTYYAPEQKGRRAKLENVEWYELAEDD